MNRDGGRNKGTRSRKSSQVRCSVCLRNGQAGTQCPKKPCSPSGERGHAFKKYPMKGSNVINGRRTEDGRVCRVAEDVPVVEANILRSEPF